MVCTKPPRISQRIPGWNLQPFKRQKMSDQGSGPIRPMQGPTAPNHGRPPVGNAATQAGSTPGNVVNLFSSMPSAPPVVEPTPAAPPTVDPAAAAKPAASTSGDTLVSGKEPPPVKLSDSAARRQIAELENDRKKREQEEADRKAAAAAAAAQRVQTNPLPILPPPPTSIDGAERAVRQDAADRADSRMPEQAAERRERKMHWGRVVAAMAVSMIAIIAVAAGTSSKEKPISADPTPSSSATATPTSSATTKPTSKPTATATPTAKPKPTATTAPAPGSCVPVTQEWIDAQPWAAERKGSNNMTNFSTQNWPKNLNCGKNDANMKWVDAKHVDISNCCQ